MFKLLAKLWRWLKRWFIRQPPTPPPPPTQPSDLDYENVVLALLAEVAQGKTWGQLQAFLISRNVHQQRLAEWLQEFGQRWLAQPEVHQELARRLRRLGEMAHGELARVARELAEGLLVVPEPDNFVITESAISEGNEQGASLSEVEKLNQLLAGLNGSGYNQKPVPASNYSTVSDADLCCNHGIELGKLGRNEEALANFDRAISLQPDYYQAWRGRGVVLGMLGRYEEALANFDRAISLQPDYYKTWDNRGAVLFELGRHEEALANFDQAISLQTDYYPAWKNWGAALFKLGRHEEALANFDQVISLQPDDYQAWFNRGVVLFELGRHEEALANFDQAISFQPDNYQAWFKRGIVLFELGRNEEALANFDQVISFQPDDYQAWFKRGVALGELGRNEEALANFDQVISFQPNDYQAWNNRGVMLFELGRHEEALTSYDQVISLQPDDYQAWFNRGIALGKLGRNEEALANFDQVISFQPNDYQAWFKRGVVLFELGRHEEALTSYDQVISLQPDDYQAWFKRGVVLGELGRHEEALANFDQAISFQPDDYQAWFNRGIALGELGRHEKALANFDQAISLQPDDYQAWFNRGIALGKLGRHEEALASYDQAISLQPDYYQAWFNRGVVLGELGRQEEALTSYDQVISLQPDYYKAWDNRGIALLELGRYEEALANFDRAISLQPDDYKTWDNRGIALLELGRYEEALANFDQAISLQSDYYQAWRRKGIALSELRRNEEALANFDQAISLQPDYHQTWDNRGLVLIKLGRNEEALASYDQAISLQPDYYQAWLNRSVMLSNLGRYREALTSDDQVISLQPDDYQAWHNRGAVLMELGRYEEALANFDQAISLRPDDYQDWDNRGIALDELGRHEEALASYDQAISLQPDYYQAWSNRGVAAIKSFGYEYFCQQNLTGCFRSERNKAPDILIPTLNATNRERYLTLFQASLKSSIALLKETFADSPKVIAQLKQPPSPKLSQIIQQPPSQTLIDLIQKPLSEDVIAKIAQDSLKHPSLSNPQLNLRGYEGRIASYQAPLDKTIRRDTHPEGWGVLHHQTGRAHYFQGRQSAKPSSFWRKAETSYKTALQTLKPPEFEELHLKVLQDLIRVLLDLGKIEEARELQRRGADLLQRLLADPKRTTPQKQKLALKSALFNQLTVDLAMQSGDIAGALTLAETGKNTCLRWFLGYEEVPELDYRQIQRLLTPTTAAIYWHLSPSALTTFVIVPDALQVVLTQRNAEGNAEVRRGFIDMNDQRSASLQHVLAWEKWLTEWNQCYQAYRSSKEKANGTDKKQHPWRRQMVESFQELRAILNISGIIEYLQNQPIENLILIPHRDLHRFPLHYFFPNYTCTYLPSAYSKLRLILEDEENRDDGGNFPINDTPDNCPLLHSLLLVENPKSTPFIQGKATPLSDLPFAEVEAALIRQPFSQITLIANPNATRKSLCQSLQTPHHVFHFTGHGAYNPSNPAQSCLFLHDTDQLTLTDIIHLDLRDYYLACLCACETAMTGDETITDEYVGLVSAFLKAGVTYVISPLWTVESAASALLIVKFYQHLEAGQSPPMALKSAQNWLKTANCEQLIEWLDQVIPQLAQYKSLQLVLQDQRDLLDRMENNAPPYCHPYYWAAFTISGV